MKKPAVSIVSPALVNANNGNWQTAWRWSRLLAPNFDCRIVKTWSPQSCDAVAMLALHADRSADSIESWAQHRSSRRLAVVLTGTDLYRDIKTSKKAQRSLQLAHSLVVLQELGTQALPLTVRDKARVIFQSTSTRQTLEKRSARLKAVMVGHLREEKSPQTLMQAAALLVDRPDIYIDHLGESLDPKLAAMALQTAGNYPQYRWLGGVTHEAARRRIQRAHVLVHCSQMEGGAHVIMEAICSGTPVLATRVDGNVGMLGADYAGYFEWGDAQGLAQLLMRCEADRAFLSLLKAQCDLRAPLFSTHRERQALQNLLESLIN